MWAGLRLTGGARPIVQLCRFGSGYILAMQLCSSSPPGIAEITLPKEGVMKTLVAVAILALFAISASATTVSFVPPAGGFPSGGGFLPGNATTVTIGGVAINGYTLSGGA